MVFEARKVIIASHCLNIALFYDTDCNILYGCRVKQSILPSQDTMEVPERAAGPV